jgi:hypothetical protein
MRRELLAELRDINLFKDWLDCSFSQHVSAAVYLYHIVYATKQWTSLI